LATEGVTAGELPIPLVVDSPSSTAKGTLLMPSKGGFSEQLRVLGDLIALAIGSTWLVMSLVGTRKGRTVLVAMTDSELFGIFLRAP